MNMIATGLIKDIHHLPEENDVIKHAKKQKSSPLKIKDPFGSIITKEEAIIIEYILAEIIELAGHVTKDNQKKRFSAMAVIIAIYNDEDLKKLANKYIRNYIPTLSELKFLGGIRWAMYFMKKKEPYSPIEKGTTAKIVYPQYEIWYKQNIHEAFEKQMDITEQKLLNADRKTIQRWLAMGITFNKISIPILHDVAKKFQISIPKNASREKIINLFHRDI